MCQNPGLLLLTGPYLYTDAVKFTLQLKQPKTRSMPHSPATWKWRVDAASHEWIAYSNKNAAQIEQAVRVPLSLTYYSAFNIILYLYS